jgi:acyl-CoA synthetase (AMP-forming)/AMP-acid ligase II
MTETAPCYIANPPKRYKLGSIGFLLLNAKMKIRDDEIDNHDIPFGESGEIICTGLQVMKGYLNLLNESGKHCVKLTANVGYFLAMRDKWTRKVIFLFVLAPKKC